MSFRQNPFQYGTDPFCPRVNLCHHFFGRFGHQSHIPLCQQQVYRFDSTCTNRHT